ncbi:MAG: glycosyltransferase family 4 protein [Desulfosalsimonas sp.]
MNSKSYILIPNDHRLGGVANYYKTLQAHLPPEYEYIYRGNASRDEYKLAIPWRMLKDYALFRKKTRTGTKAIVINSSLGTGGFFRDGLYFLLAPKQAGKIVFFHGWNPRFEKKIDGSTFLMTWMKRTFLKADHIIVLYSEFKNKLRHWGYTGPVSLGSTIVDESLVQGVDFESLSGARKAIEGINILYLGNVSRDKGVWKILKAYEHLRSQNWIKDLKCIMAGEGQELEALKSHARDNGLDIDFPGYVREKQKAEAFKNSHVYVFPSAHEGMPTSVLEAMAFGLPIITTRVGGVPDFFEEGKMGFFLDSRDPEHIAEKISYLLDRPELMQQMSEYNYNYAKEHFYAGKVVRWFQDIVESVIRVKNE